MTRPLYETEDDLNIELSFKQKIEDAGAKLYKLPISYKLDFLVEKQNKAYAMAEIKVRKCKSTEFPTLMLSLAKFKEGVMYSKLLGLKFIIFIRWLDRDGFYIYNAKEEVNISFAGRTKQTRDDADIEPCVFIPIIKFIIF